MSDIADRTAVTLWVCEDCMLHHANGECGDCPHPPERDGRGRFIAFRGQGPLCLIDYTNSALGMGWEDHAEGCPNRVSKCSGEYVECDCETRSFSTSRCDGCGSFLHGARHAMTEWIKR